MLNDDVPPRPLLHPISYRTPVTKGGEEKARLSKSSKTTGKTCHGECLFAFSFRSFGTLKLGKVKRMVKRRRIFSHPPAFLSFPPERTRTRSLQVISVDLYRPRIGL